MRNNTVLKCFLALVQTLSFTEAGHCLGITQQSVSKSIAKLEADLGVMLFVRNHHSVQLTVEGEQFYKLFHNFSNDLTRLTQMYGRNTDGNSILQLGVSEGLDVSEALKYASWSTGQEIRVSVLPKPELEDMFRAGRLDAMLDLQQTAPQEGPSCVVIARVPMMLLSAQHLFPENLEQALELPIILVSGEGENRKRLLNRHHALGLTATRVIFAPNQKSAQLMLLLGQGVMISSAYSDFVTDSRVRSFPLEQTDLLVCRRQADTESMSAFLAALTDFYQDRFLTPAAELKPV